MIDNDYQDTSPDVALTHDQRQRMREVVRNIPKEIEAFVNRYAQEALANVGLSEQALIPEHRREGRRFIEDMSNELTAFLQQAFTELPYTTGVLTEQLMQSRRRLAAKTFLNTNTPEETKFYLEASNLYARLCETVEQQILFSPENLPNTPSSGRVH